MAAAVTTARMMIKLAHDFRDETLRVPKEREDEFLKSLSRQQLLNEHTWMLIRFLPVSRQPLMLEHINAKLCRKLRIGDELA